MHGDTSDVQRHGEWVSCRCSGHGKKSLDSGLLAMSRPKAQGSTSLAACVNAIPPIRMIRISMLSDWRASRDESREHGLGVACVLPRSRTDPSDEAGPQSYSCRRRVGLCLKSMLSGSVHVLRTRPCLFSILFRVTAQAIGAKQSLTAHSSCWRKTWYVRTTADLPPNGGLWSRFKLRK